MSICAKNLKMSRRLDVEDQLKVKTTCTKFIFHKENPIEL